MPKELSASRSAQLAQQIYFVNSGDTKELKRFLGQRIFAQGGSSQTVMKADVGGRVIRAARDSFGVCARGAGDYDGDLFLIFRGTTDANNKADWLTDARIGICSSKTGLPVHVGFNHAFNSMLPEIREFITKSNATGYIHCIGHSLGGAVASLAADWVSKNRANTVKLYTFGAPRVGTHFFVRSTTTSVGDANMHRVYHRTDPVPMVALFPFMQAPWSAVGHHYLYSSQPLTASDNAHLMRNYVESCKQKSWESLSGVPEQPYSIERAIEEWLKSKSPVDSSSAAFWRWADSALIYVLKKILMGVTWSLQAAVMGVMTLADKIAYLLAKGIELADHISKWVELLMRKLMQAFHMKAPPTRKELTQDLMRRVLVRLTQESNRYARNALKSIK